jgi:dolichol-phosphate mannosyltransferase
VKLGIAIPTYNEVGNVPKLIDQIHSNLGKIPGLETTILIIDDNSPDGTGKLVKKLSKKYAAKNFKVVLLSRKVKNGLGQAYIDGIGHLVKLGVDYVAQMDADLSHNPKYLPLFVEASKSNEFIVGTRYISGGATPDWSLTRRILSKSGNMYARLILSDKISDYTGGYNMYSVDLIKKIDLSHIESKGYGFLIELKYKASRKANGVHQIPIVFNDRTHGKSKIPKNTIIKNLILVPKLKKKLRI